MANVKEVTAWILVFFCLTFMSFIHFEFIFMYGVRQWPSFILPHVAVQFSQHHLLKKLSYFHRIFFLHCWRWVHHILVGSFLGFLFCSIDLCICFCISTILSWWLQLCNITQNPELWCLQIYFSFSGLLWLFRVFCGSMKSLGLFVLALWKTRGIALNVWIALGSIYILTIFVIPIHENGLFFHLFVPSSSFSSLFYSFHSTNLLPFWLGLFLSILWVLVQL